MDDPYKLDLNALPKTIRVSVTCVHHGVLYEAVEEIEFSGSVNAVENAAGAAFVRLHPAVVLNGPVISKKVR